MTKSERRIRESFLALLDEQGFYSIRVSMILERADVSRATFYSIYEDKYQLLQTLEDELLAGLEAIMVRIRTGGRNVLVCDEPTNPVFLEYFNYVKEHQQLWRLFMTGKGDSNFSDKLSHFFYDRISGTQVQWEADPEIPADHSAVLVSWAYVALFSYWITTGMKDTPETMAHTLTVFWNRFMKW